MRVCLCGVSPCSVCVNVTREEDKDNSHGEEIRAGAIVCGHVQSFN